MILGRGSAQNDEAIIAEYQQFLAQGASIQHPAVLQRLRTAPAAMCRRIGRPIATWSDEEILALYRDRAKSTWTVYNAFLAFLFFRGYRRASLAILLSLQTDLSRHWRPYLLPYRQKIEQAMRDLGYRPGNTSSMLNLLLWVLAISGKALEELTRADFDPFAEAYHAWYRKAWANGRLNPRLMRLEKVLVQWGVLPTRGRVFRHEEHFAALRQETFRAAILRYLQWCEVRYQPSTIDNARAALLSFFLWLQEQEPGCGRLDGVSRSVALSYGQHLKAQGEAGRYSASYQRELHTYIRQFFDFAIDERLPTSPDRNPFSVRDLPRPQEMIPRYLSDQELRTILTYCEGEASLFERTIVITLLHTGVRAMELTQLKASDIVQIGGVWKLHIHLGKGLKDRLIPLTPQCLSALQAWQERGWERIADALFTTHGRPYLNSGLVTRAVHELGRKLGIPTLTAHRFRHTFAVALLNYGIRESALQKLMGHATLGMTLEYARILDQTVEQSFSQALEQMQEGPHSWIPTFFVQEEYTLFAQGDTVSWIRLPVGYCRRNPKLHCESDVKCLLCERFAASREDLPRLRQMQERFRALGLQLKADVVAAQIHHLETSPAEAPSGFIPLQAISTATRR